MNGANPVLDQPQDKNALTLLFMSLEDAHEPRGRLLTGGCRSFAMTALLRGWRRI